MRVNKTIYCEKCCGEIKNKDDLVVATSSFRLASYHEKCYSKELKSINTLFISNEPMNGGIANIMSMVAIFMALGVLIFLPDFWYISLALVLFLGIRLFSWIKYERFL